MHRLQRCGLLLPMFRGLCVCVSVCLLSSTKTAEPIDMPFGMWTRVVPRNHALGEARPRGRGNFFLGGMSGHIVEYREYPS